MKIKKGDFVELEYIGRVKGINIIFDLTDEKLAKENKLYDPKMKYGPIIVCIGEGQILPGLDSDLIGRETDKKYEIKLNVERGFGKKDAKLIRIVPVKKFFDQEINPMPGLQVNFDGMVGMVRAVSGGRVIVDFNHPLAGRELIYEVNIKRKIDDLKEKLENLLYFELGLKDKYEVDIKPEKITIILDKEIPKDVNKKFVKKVRELIPKINKLEIVKKQLLKNN